jgi:NADH:ubiquinone oxidoreductase subunit 6 (subunit J)
MSVEQVVFVLAGTVSVVGAIIAVTHRDPRASGAALLGVLLALAVLYASLAAPVVAAAVVVVALFATVPLIVHLSVPASRAHTTGGPLVSGAALLLAAALLAIIAVAITVGEVPVNVSVRSSDGYDLAALGGTLTGRAAVAAGGSVLVLLAAVATARAARRDRRSPP